MIKQFRAWNPIRKEYVPWALEDGFALNGEFVMNQGFFQDDYKLKREEICSLEFEQCYGKPDKNGRMIFENDLISLVNAEGKTIKVVCKFGLVNREIHGNLVEITGFYFQILDNNRKTFPIVNNYLGKHDLELFEIIGTMHDGEVTT